MALRIDFEKLYNTSEKLSTNTMDAFVSKLVTSGSVCEICFNETNEIPLFISFDSCFQLQREIIVGLC